MTKVFNYENLIVIDYRKYIFSHHHLEWCQTLHKWQVWVEVVLWWINDQQDGLRDIHLEDRHFGDEITLVRQQIWWRLFHSMSHWIWCYKFELIMEKGLEYLCPMNIHGKNNINASPYMVLNTKLLFNYPQVTNVFIW